MLLNGLGVNGLLVRFYPVFNRVDFPDAAECE